MGGSLRYRQTAFAKSLDNRNFQPLLWCFGGSLCGLQKKKISHTREGPAHERALSRAEFSFCRAISKMSRYKIPFYGPTRSIFIIVFSVSVFSPALAASILLPRVFGTGV